MSDHELRAPRRAPAEKIHLEPSGNEVAIIGMVGRFPGADELKDFWANLRDGVESLTVLSDAELRAAGVAEEMIADPKYVRRASVIEGIEEFDADFFGYTPLEATVMDPQQRLFLECSWQLFEQAGYDPARLGKPVGVFTGAKTNTYLFSLVAERERFPGLDNFQIAIGNDLAAMATRVSFKLDLRGPSYALHTACSTSLVTVHLACQSLLLDECAMAVAGGASINVPQKRGYPYQPGGLLSPDGSCRTFDADAAGSNFGNGVGAVLLKRLDDAVADRDHIHAVIRGSATNNDGAAKASFTAPGVEGQTEVLLEAMAVAGVDANHISYIEAHGTATQLGDSIEILALSEAFRAAGWDGGSCAIGSAKTNLGHLETAAGVTGLIKTALALERRQLPPSLHFEQPNPRIDFASSPFEVNPALRPWPAPPDGGKRIAGVSSFGIGSTNAHVILEEPPPRAPTDADHPWQLLTLSARSVDALERQGGRLRAHLTEEAELALADVAFTLAVGRKSFDHRSYLVCRDRATAIEALGEATAQRRGEVTIASRKVAFLFPGLGEHYPEMGLGLYQREPVFRQQVDRCAQLLEPTLGLDLRTVLYPRGLDAAEAVVRPDLRSILGRGGEQGPQPPSPLDQTALAQPALFVTEYALAQLLLARGVEPCALIGYSLGEYLCACLAGVMALEEALDLVAYRAALIDRMEEGAMLAVPLPEGELVPRLQQHQLCLAAVNGISGCVASGTEVAIEALASELAAEGVATRRLETSHAFHSRMMEGAVEELLARLATIDLSPPRIPYLSNVTGDWIENEEATDPEYWARHLVRTVRFAEGLDRLLALEGEPALLEVGPGQSLTSFALLHPERTAARPVVSTMRQRAGGGAEVELLLRALGELWLAGGAVDLASCWAGERRGRVTLPTYPFERQRYWVDSTEESFLVAHRGTSAGDEAVSSSPSAALRRIPELERWLYQPVWHEIDWPITATARGEGCWLLFADELGVAELLADELRARGVERCLLVRPGDGYLAEGPDRYRVRPTQSEDYARLLKAIATPCARVVHLWGLAPPTVEASGKGDSLGSPAFRAEQERGLYSLVALVRALSGTSAAIDLVTHGALPAANGAVQAAERATLLGAVVAIPQELPRVSLRLIDTPLAAEILTGSGQEGSKLAKWVERLTVELLDKEVDSLVVAHREERRLERRFEPAELPTRSATTGFRAGGTYLLIGGLGGIGLELASHLAGMGARLVLTRRTPMPEREAWDAVLAEAPPGDKTARVIERVRDLEEAGAEVMVADLDLADEGSLRGLIARLRERFAGLHGVVHMAGVLAAESFVPLNRVKRADFEIHFRPKVDGLYALERCLEPVAELELCLLFSSISALLGGGLGSLAYSAANAFVDAFTQRHNARAAVDGRVLWRSVNWDSWREAGHKAGGGEPAVEDSSAFGTTLEALAMEPEEGIEVLLRLASRQASGPVVVSTGDLASRFEQWVATPNRRQLPRSAAAQPRPSGGALTERIARIWSRVLGRPEIAPDANFFDLGGNSLLGLQVITEINRELAGELSPVELFEAPTVEALARLLEPEAAASESPTVALGEGAAASEPSGSMAIIGMAGRFPGAENLEGYWRNLRDGIESVSFFDPEELLASGVDPALAADPDYVPARPIMPRAEFFDAALFGYSPREAELMDPQHRVFLECAWASLEDAGYDPLRYPGAIGTFAGCALNTYLLHNVMPHAESLAGVDPLQMIIGSDKDSLTTNVSYRLDLKGPSMAVQTYCSTALVAVHLAARSLRAGDCDMALAGGVSIVMPQQTGYLYQSDSILSPDGHCRPFDAKAGGTLFGNGVGVVVLKRLERALADGDRIYAVVRGSAINNDGSLKAGYTAPSVVGQARVVAAALEDAGVEPASIDYVEAHGTGTAMGDPIEVAALTRAFRDRQALEPVGEPLANGFCALGSVKGNMGHLDRAAGVASLIKSVLALSHGQIPPTLNFERPNPKIDFEQSPFFVNTTLRDWPANPARPRRAGVSALGFGGTNVHLVLEEAPLAEAPERDEPGLGAEILLLSARTREALATMGEGLADHWKDHPELDLIDIAHTLQVGRRALAHRRYLVVPSGPEAEESAQTALASTVDGRVHSPVVSARAVAPKTAAKVAFLFPGQGSQHPGMGRELYRGEPLFRSELDRCAEILSPRLGIDLARLIYPTTTSAGEAREAAQRLRDTQLTQPALFAVEYALARMWMGWGVVPTALAGHSIGEYVAACLAGVFELEEALLVVAERGRLMAEMAPGAMLAVALSQEQLEPWLADRELSLAAANGRDRMVVSGSRSEVEQLAQKLAEDEVECRRLHTSHAFHSALVGPAARGLTQRVMAARPQTPRIPMLSCLSGDWLSDEEATDPAYWGEQLRGTVRFADMLDRLAQSTATVWLEVGPGEALSRLARRHLAQGDGDSANAVRAFPSLPTPSEERSASEAALEALGQLWLAGVSTLDWSQTHGARLGRRVTLPAYPFESRRYCLDPNPASGGASHPSATRPGEWLWLPSWRRITELIGGRPDEAASPRSWLVLDDGGELGAELARRLRAAGNRVTLARPGREFSQLGNDVFTLRPGARGDYAQLVASLAPTPEAVLHLWGLQGNKAGGVDPEASLALLARALDELAVSLGLWLVTDGAHDVLGRERDRASSVLAVAACARVERHSRHVVCRHLDLDLATDSTADAVTALLRETKSASEELSVARRGAARFVPIVEPALSPGSTGNGDHGGFEFHAGGEQRVERYLILGGTEPLGASVARVIEREVAARGHRAHLVLADRNPIPERPLWEALEGRQATSSEEMEEAIAAYVEQQRLGLAVDSWPEELAQRWRLAHAEATPDPLPEGFSAAADSLCAAYAYRLFERGAGVEPGGRYREEDLVAKIAPVAPYDKLIGYLLRALEVEGWVEREERGEGERFHFRQPPEEPPDRLHAALAERFADFRPGLDCLAHCAASMLEVVRGELDASRVLYPEGSPAMLQGLMKAQRRFSVSPALQASVAATVRDLARRRADDGGCRPLRILELGGGEGSLTWPLLEALATLPEGVGARVDYLFTDLQRPFLEAARRSARARGWEERLRFERFDLDREPEEQGLELHSFDVVVGLDVVHLTADLVQTLARVRRLLVPEGLALLIEPGGDQRWVSMIWGLTEEWWSYADLAVRPITPLLEGAKWPKLVRDEVGFAAVSILPGDADQRLVDHLLIAAQVPRQLRDDSFLARAARHVERRRERIVERIRQVRKLEEAGAWVQVEGVDSDAPAGWTSVAQAALADGNLDGVLWCDGPWNDGEERSQEGRWLGTEAPAAGEALDGIEELSAALGERRPAMSWLVSPLSAALRASERDVDAAWDGRLAEYAANNCAAIDDAADNGHRGKGTGPWSSVVWGLGGDAATEVPASLAATAVARLRASTEPPPRVILSHRSPRWLAEGWNRPPAKLSARSETSAGTAVLAAEEGREWSEDETGLAEIWSAVLGVERLVPSDSFFDLGGDSLIATQVQARLREHFGFEVPMEALFANPTLEGQAEAVAQARGLRDREQHQKVLHTLAEMSESEAMSALEGLLEEARTDSDSTPKGALT